MIFVYFTMNIVVYKFPNIKHLRKHNKLFILMKYDFPFLKFFKIRSIRCIRSLY